MPRREYTKRDDYDVMIARNRHTLTHTGWVHEQDNYKLVLRDGERRVLAREVGLNTYDHVQIAKADAARGYWSRTHEFWEDVRAAWARILVPGASVQLRSTVDEKKLWESMFELAGQFGEERDTSARDEIGPVLEAFLAPEPTRVSQSGR